MTLQSQFYTDKAEKISISIIGSGQDSRFPYSIKGHLTPETEQERSYYGSYNY
jgi:hypothetical protein